MKRRSIHLAFGTVVILCSAMGSYYALRLYQLEQSNAEISRLNALVPGVKLTTGESNSAAVMLAKANALAKEDKTEAAARAYGQLIAADAAGWHGRAALFNLGNLYLRQGMRITDNGTPEALSMIELAKQRYRDLLKQSPDDWDARYNLERALRLAPEEQGDVADAEKDIKERRRVMLRGMSSVRLP